MVNTVYIRFLTDTCDQIEWTILDNDYNIIHPPEKSALETVKNTFKGHSIILFIPGSMVTITVAKLPPASKTRMMQALPYALEEQLVDDVSDLHFILGNSLAAQTYAVAIIAKNTIENWLKPWQDPVFYCQCMLPDFLAYPYFDSTWTIVIERHYANVRMGPLSGFSTDLGNLYVFLQSAIDTQQGIPPLYIKIYNYVTDYIPDLKKLDLLGATVSIENSNDSLIMALAKHYQTALSLNLLQGSYRQMPTLARNKSWWKIVAVLLSILVILSLIKNTYLFFHLQHHLNTIDNQIALLYKKIFPESTSIVAPKLRVERELNKLEQHQGGGSFLGLLARTGTILKSLSSLSIKVLAFQQGQLSLNVEASNFETLEQASQLLKKEGLQVSQENASSFENHVTARFIIKGS